MEKKYTPGPWVFQLQEIKGKTEANYYEILSKDGFHNGAPNQTESTSGFGLSGYVNESDAKLIAAAPELLEALQEIMRFQTSLEIVMGNGLQSPENFWKALDQAKLVIKKATE
jgi:hypothetical protein